MQQSTTMFLPDSNHGDTQEEIRAACARVEEMALELVPQELREDAHITVQEVQCGDPNCAPIDTAVTVVFNSGGRGMLGLPMEAKEVTPPELKNVFPPAAILKRWHAGEDVDWPPMEEEWDEGGALPGGMPQLRFEVGQKVLCRIGRDTWGPGEIVQLWYREAHWPAQSWAPYKIKLDDGRDIFAPGDLDQVIKVNPNP